MKTKKQAVPKWFKGMIYDQGEKLQTLLVSYSYELNAIELSIYDFIMGTAYIYLRLLQKLLHRKLLVIIKKH